MTALNTGASRCRQGLLLAGACLFGLPATAQTLVIERFEPIAITEASAPRAAAGPRSAGRELRFEALGRRFALHIEPHARLAALAVAARSTAEPYEGVLEGRSGSWVRLTRVDGRWTGLVFDGVEHFAIEPAGAIAAFHPGARGLAPDVPVLFRLADARMEGVSVDGDTVPTDLDSLAQQLGGEPPTAAATTTTLRLDVGVVLDPQQITRDGGPDSARGNTISRINLVDGLYVDQLGVHLRLDAPVLIESEASSPFTSSVPNDLLEELRNWRGSSASNQSPRNGLTHLFTGRDLEGNTVGIAYSASLCAGRVSASLSQATSVTSFDALIAAHEIGHVFGAPHDGDAEHACASAPTTGFVMASSISNATPRRFSDCSVTEIQKFMATRQCLAPLGAPDVAVGGPGTASIALNQPSTVTLSVTSNGSEIARNVRMAVALRGGVTVAGAGGTGGTVCTPQQPTSVACTFGDLSPGERRDVELSLVAAAAVPSFADVEVTADGDLLDSNGLLTTRLVASPGADLGLSVLMAQSSITAGSTTVARITLRNDGLNAVGDAVLTITPDTGLAPVAVVSASGIACAVSGGTATCEPASLASGATAELQLEVRAQSDAVGPRRLQLRVASAGTVDPQPGNNGVAGAVVVTAAATAPPTPAPPTPPAPSPGGGGGGRLDGALLLVLLAFLGRLGGARRREGR